MTYPVLNVTLLRGQLQVQTLSGKILGPNQPIVVHSVGKERIYLERVPFSWYDLLTSRMVVMGGASMLMVFIMQLLLRTIDLEDVKREFRGEPPQQGETINEAPAGSRSRKAKKGE